MSLRFNIINNFHKIFNSRFVKPAAILFCAGFFVCLLALPSVTKASYTDYADTILIVNDNSATSTAIADYFVSKRTNFDASHVVHISTVTTESVSRSEYNANIKTAIETWLTANDSAGAINYVILTKGVPIVLTDTANSVDSELMWCLGKSSCSTGIVSNPFYNSSMAFSHLVYNMYLVTRLDGYTPDGDITQIEAVIDHTQSSAIPSEAVIKSTGLFVLDGGGAYDHTANPWLESANTLLTAKGYTVILDETSTYLKNQSNVIGYWSWGSNSGGCSGAACAPANTYLNGAIGETAVSTSGRSLAYPPSYGQSLITDWIAEGISGMKGYVAEPYMTAIAHPDILFDKYTDGYNLADSYYSASQVVNWRDIVIGDPKVLIVQGLSEDGVCGSSNSSYFYTAPTTNLCSYGTSTGASGSGPFTWTCVGTNSGATVSCSATKKTDGVCGSSNGQGFTEEPTTNLCSTGDASSIVSGSNSWAWSCSGTNTGLASYCSAVVPPNATTSLLYSFLGGTDIRSPKGPLVLSGSTFYGTTALGGVTATGGTIFSVNMDGTASAILHSFGGLSPAPKQPVSAPTLSGSTLYGMTKSGGTGTSGGKGVIFSINTDGTGYTVLYDFNIAISNGWAPYSSFTLSGSKLYGTTSRGGTSDKGVIFSINTDGTGYAVLHSFAGGTSDGEDLTVISNRLILSGSKLYGTAKAGGTSNFGTIFSINTDGTDYQILYNFAGGASDGSAPGLLVLSASTFYGVTSSGGTSNFGTIFSINTDGTGYQVLYNFAGGTGDGSAPYHSLTLSGSTFYGVTPAGGTSNFGTIFSINTDGTGYQILYNFVGGTNDGTIPGGFVLSGSTLYGATMGGGATANGTLFSYGPLSSATTGTSVSFSANTNNTYAGQYITLTATASPSTATGFVVFNDGSSWLGTVTLTAAMNGVASYTTSALTAGVHSLTAVYSGDGTYTESTSNTVTQTVLPGDAPGAPTGLTATAGDSQASLSWTAPEDNGGYAITDYLVQYKVASQPWADFTHTAQTTTSITVTGLTNGSTYDFQVSAVNSIGTGTPSDSVELALPVISTTKAITAFSFASLTPVVTATISGTSITATVPYGTSVTALVATFTTTGNSVKIGSTTQTSGTTPNDFTNPVIYTVTAEDSTTQNYTVTVTVASGGGNSYILYLLQQSKIQTTSETLQSKIQNLILQINNLKAQLAAMQQPVSASFTQTLQYGSRGTQVALLQDKLKELGFFPIATTSNGNFGPATLKAVQDFQLQNNITQPTIYGYGIVGPRTRAALNSL